MPAPEEQDVFYTGARADAVWNSLKRGEEGGSNWVYAPIDEVRRRVLSVGYPPTRFISFRAWLKTRCRSTPRLQLRCSAWTLISIVQRSTSLSISILDWQRGGVLVVDDYGAFRGAQQAVDEYIAENNIQIFLNRIDEHVRFAIKP